jgi:hypothetical protein
MRLALRAFLDTALPMPTWLMKPCQSWVAPTMSCLLTLTYGAEKSAASLYTPSASALYPAGVRCTLSLAVTLRSSGTWSATVVLPVSAPSEPGQTQSTFFLHDLVTLWPYDCETCEDLKKSIMDKCSILYSVNTVSGVKAVGKHETELLYLIPCKRKRKLVPPAPKTTTL